MVKAVQIKRGLNLVTAHRWERLRSLSQGGARLELSSFTVPERIYAAWDARDRGAASEADWRAQFAAYKIAEPALAVEYERRMSGDLPEAFANAIDGYIAGCIADEADMVRGKRHKPRSMLSVRWCLNYSVDC